jgi:PPM family protein phosphatase
VRLFSLVNSSHVLQENIEYVAFSSQNDRENNEDSFLVSALLPRPGHPPVILLAVADGMGGHAHGEDISREVLRKFCLCLCEQLVVMPSINHSDFTHQLGIETLQHALLEALEVVNIHINNIVESNQWKKAGSTIVAAMIQQDEVVAVNVGDSPLYHFKKRTGELTRITEDHTVACALVRAGKITPGMARVHEGHNQLEYYLGGIDLPREQAAHRFELEGEDLLLLCSDGISNSLSEKQIGKVLASSQVDLENMAEDLISSALSGGSTDNQTLVLLRHRGR